MEWVHEKQKNRSCLYYFLLRLFHHFLALTCCWMACKISEDWKLLRASKQNLTINYITHDFRCPSRHFFNVGFRKAPSFNWDFFWILPASSSWGNTGIFHWSWDEWILLLVKSFVEWLLDFRNGWNCYLQLFFLESIVPTISVFRTDKKLAKILHHQPKNMKQTVPDGWNCQNIKTLSPFWCLTKDQPTDTSNFFGWAMGPVKAIISIAYSHYTP